MGSRTHQPFPVALYAGLVVALLGLVRPGPLRAVESVAASVALLPLRAWAAVVGPRPGAAAAPAEARELAGERVTAALRQLERAASRRPAAIPVDWWPVVARVVDRRGPGEGRTERLVLDLPRAMLGPRALDSVTRDGTLLGFLDPHGLPPTDADGRPEPLAGLAQVRLVDDAGGPFGPRRVPVRVDAGERGSFEALVEPAAPIDRWPLRLAMLGDPYLAAEVRQGPFAVWTSGLEDDPLGALPVGLRLGTLRVFGYRDGPERALVIGLYVEPDQRADALAFVVLWVADRALAQRAQRAALDARPLAGGRLDEVQLLRLDVAGATRERWLATCAGAVLRPLPRGAAVVDGERLLGVLDAAGLGSGVVAAFGQPGRRWSLTLVPATAERAPVELRARCVARDGDLVTLAADEPPPVELTRGAQLATGGDGPDLPAFVWIGPVLATDGARFVVRHVDPLRQPPQAWVHTRAAGGAAR
ncbi:MAG: hypothetical protein IPM29_20260 [Planctomycetes bacterium]|nr:hypothetical protein [Planctomycetota bacterium]